MHGGGWVTQETLCRPRTRFFGVLALIWVVVSICASIPFWNGWPESFRWLEWLCVALLLPQIVFFVLAVVFFLTEQPHAVVEYQPNPDCDVRNLY